MRHNLTILFLLSLSANCFAQIADTSRFPRDSYPYWVAGLPGYTNPVYGTTLYLTNFGSVSDGVTDNSLAWTNCYNAAADLTTIVMPPGVTKITNYITSGSAKRIRVVGTGSLGGPYKSGKSLLLLSAGVPNGSSVNGAPIIIGGDSSRNAALVTAGFTRGSNSLTVSSVAGMAVGQVCRFYETNDNPNYVLANYPNQFWDGGGSGACDASHQPNKWGVFEGGNTCSNSFAHRGQVFRITGIAGNVLTISSPIYWPHYNISNVPTIEAFDHTATQIGFENLVISYSGQADYIFYSIFSDRTWITSCCTSNSNHAHIQLTCSYQSKVWGNQTWGHVVNDSNAREAVALERCSETLVENNSLEFGNISVKTQLSDSGDVISYNFSHLGYVTNSGNPIIDGSVFAGVTGTHGDDANYELHEGNVFVQYSGDSFWGGSDRNTVFRNWFTRDGYSGVLGNIRFNQGGEAFDIDSSNWVYTVVFNVIGSGRDFGDVNPSHTVANIGYARSSLPVANVPPAAPADTNVLKTLIWHGNVDMVIRMPQYSNGIPQVASNSYYLTTKPDWFGTMPWPPIGPDVPASFAAGINLSNTILIPAQGFEMYGTNPPPASGDPIISVQPLSPTVYSSQSASFSVTATGGSTLSYQWKFNGLNVGTGTSTYVRSGCTVADSGAIVKVVVSDLAGAVTSLDAILTVLPDPIITTQPTSLTINSGANASFSVVASGQTALTYQWKLNGATISGATSSSYSTNAVPSGASGNAYSVTCTDTAGSTNSSSAILTVKALGPPGKFHIKSGRVQTVVIQ